MKFLCTLALASLFATSALAQETPTTEPTFTIARWKGKLYGFAEFDSIYDTTQSFSEIQGNGVISKPGTVGGDNARLQFSPRNTRLGFSLESPKTAGGLRGVGLIEGDFFGFDPGPFAATSSGNSEAGFYNNPTFRIRHAWVKLETPVLDILAGQSWELFGWQGTAHPASVELQGLPGQAYSRTTQLRLSKTVDAGSAASLDIAVAALRPPQRNAALPDLQAGLKFNFKDWSGYRTAGGTSSGLAPLQIGISGLYRQFKLQNGASTSATPSTDFLTGSGSAFAIDALIPIIPATKESKANALTFVGEYTRGRGYADLFTGFSGGAATVTPGFPATYTPDVDGGLVGVPIDQLVGVEWRTAMANLQYYTPIMDGAVWLSAIYSDTKSNNVQQFNPGLYTGKATVFYGQKYYSGNLFIDPIPSVRIGAAVSYTTQDISDNTSRSNVRGQLSLWYLFL